MRNTEKGPTDAMISERGQPQLKATSATSVWEIPGDVPATRRRREPAPSQAVEATASSDVIDNSPDSRPGSYDQREERPAMLERMLSPPLEASKSTMSARPPERTSAKRKGVLGLAAVLLVAGLIGGYAVTQQQADAVMPVAASQQAPLVAKAVTPVMVDPQVVLEQAPPHVAVADSPPRAVSLKASVRQTSGPRVITHVVQKGDTLWDLAQHYTHDPFRYAQLARHSHIANPDLIYPGQVVRIEVASSGDAL